MMAVWENRVPDYGGARCALAGWSDYLKLN